jgi:starvation-inducible DNA-binding protein
MATDFNPISIGISDSKKKAIADGLRELLADTFTLLIKTYSYHWHVTGPVFSQAHALFGGQYEELFEAIDEIAERIRALGYQAPGSLREFLKLSSVKDSEGLVPYTRMLVELANDQQQVVKCCRETLKLANAENDAPTIDLLTKRMQAHEKAAWMLRATMS